MPRPGRASRREFFRPALGPQPEGDPCLRGGRILETGRATGIGHGPLGAGRPSRRHVHGEDGTASGQRVNDLQEQPVILVYTADSPIHGTGVFSSARLSPGEVVLRIDDSRVVTDAEPLDPAKGEFEHHCDYLADGRVVLMRHPERSINHSCDPNTYIRTIAGDRYVVALRPIRPGEEITYDYCVNGDGDTAWECSCGSPACRKHHLSGFFHLPEDVQARYLALLEDWFVAEHRDEVEALKRRVEATRESESPDGEPSPVGAGRRGERRRGTRATGHRPGRQPRPLGRGDGEPLRGRLGEPGTRLAPGAGPLPGPRRRLRRRAAGRLRQARLGRRRPRLRPGHHRASRVPAAWDRAAAGRAGRRDRRGDRRRVAARRLRAAPGGLLRPVRLPPDPGGADAAGGR